MSDSPANDGIPKGRCPICTKPRDGKWTPFCSKRCADIDLNRWFSGVYAIPAGKNGEDEGIPDGTDGE